MPIRPICETLGVAQDHHRCRINRDSVLIESVISVTITVTDIESDSRRPRTSTATAPPLDFLNGRLFGINADRDKAEVRERVIRYQRECYRVLFQALQQQQATAAPIEGVDIEELLHTAKDPEAQAYRMALAIANMARQQLVLRHQLEEHGARLKTHT